MLGRVAPHGWKYSRAGVLRTHRTGRRGEVNPRNPSDRTDDLAVGTRFSLKRVTHLALVYEPSHHVNDGIVFDFQSRTSDPSEGVTDLAFVQGLSTLFQGKTEFSNNH